LGTATRREGALALDAAAASRLVRASRQCRRRHRPGVRKKARHGRHRRFGAREQALPPPPLARRAQGSAAIAASLA
jgi:hypothetical protein